MVGREKNEWYKQLADQDIKLRIEFIGLNIEVIGDLPKILTYRGFEFIRNQLRIIQSGLPSSTGKRLVRDLGDYNYTVQLQYSIPYCYNILKRITEKEKGPFKKQDVYYHYYTKQPLNLQDPYIRIKNPKIVEKTKGWPPKNSKVDLPID